MSSSIGKITIPTDDEGFVLLQCPLCGVYFKLNSEDMIADDVIEVTCPSCGLKSDNYLTSDVIEIAKAKTMNYALDMFHDEFKKLERSIKSSFVSFSAGPKPKHEVEGKMYDNVHIMV